MPAGCGADLRGSTAVKSLMAAAPMRRASVWYLSRDHSPYPMRHAGRAPSIPAMDVCVNTTARLASSLQAPGSHAISGSAHTGQRPHASACQDCRWPGRVGK